MKTFATYLRESLVGVKLDSDQMFQLYIKQIEVDQFAFNCGVSSKDAEKIEEYMENKQIMIVGFDQLKNIYDDKKMDELKKHMDELVEKGERNSSELMDEFNEAKEEPKKDDAKKENNKENEKQPKENKSYDDLPVVKSILTDMLNIDPTYVSKFFWKKSSTNCYLYVITGDGDVQDIINRL